MTTTDIDRTTLDRSDPYFPEKRAHEILSAAGFTTTYYNSGGGTMLCRVERPTTGSPVVLISDRSEYADDGAEGWLIGLYADADAEIAGDHSRSAEIDFDAAALVVTVARYLAIFA